MKKNIGLKRVVAYLIDLIIVTIICSSLSYIPFLNPKYDAYQKVTEEYSNYVKDYYDEKITLDEFSEKTTHLAYEMNKTGVVYTVSNLVIVFLYFGVFNLVTKGQTLGKKLMNIQIVGVKHKKVRLYQYVIRAILINGVISNVVGLVAICFKENTFHKIYNAGSNLETIIMIICFLMILFTQKQRGLHDLLSGVEVIDIKEKIEEEVEEAEYKEKEVEETKKEEEIKPKKSTSKKKTTKKEKSNE